MLRAYFADVASRYYGRQATEDEIAAAVRDEPSDDLAPHMIEPIGKVKLADLKVRLADLKVRLADLKIRDVQFALGKLAGGHGTGQQMLLAVVEVIGLGVPAWRQFGGERGMDEPGDGRGVRAAGIPLQDERHELRWFDRPDHGRGVRGCEGGDEQDPVDVALVGPAGGGQFGVREVDGRRADAR